MLESVAFSTSNMIKEKAQPSFSELVVATIFRSRVGVLQYLTSTRPVIIYAVNEVSQFLSSPTLVHLKAVKCILRYLNGTQNFGVRYITQCPKIFYAFSDADWARCPITQRSTTLFRSFFRANRISWCSKKQPTVSHSSSEAEYRSITSTIT